MLMLMRRHHTVGADILGDGSSEEVGLVDHLLVEAEHLAGRAEDEGGVRLLQLVVDVRQAGVVLLQRRVDLHRPRPPVLGPGAVPLTLKRLRMNEKRNPRF